MADLKLLDDVDVLVKPHELTEEDRKAFRDAIRNNRQSQDPLPIARRIAQLLERRGKVPSEKDV